MPDLLHTLTSYRRSAGPEMLRMWGQQAAAQFVDTGTPLNDSISKIASANDLNTHQIHRVVETANHAVFAKKFASATTAKVVEFPMADLDVISTRVAKAGGIPKRASATPSPRRHVKGSEGVNLYSALFGDLAKTAEALPESDPQGKVRRTYFKVKDAAAHLKVERDAARQKLAQSESRLLGEVRQALMRRDGDFHDLIDAIRVAGVPDVEVQKIATRLTDTLAATGVLNAKTLGHAKTAQRVPNPEHPVVRAAEEHVRAKVASAARDEVLAEMIGHLATLHRTVVGVGA
mgnify:CR=1 FL=1